MSTQPEALRLADECDTGHPLADDAIKAAAELRRLHEENERLRAQHASALLDTKCARAQRDALLGALRKARAAILSGPITEEDWKLAAAAPDLLEALKFIATTDPEISMIDPQRAARIARAAIAKVEEGK